jgi:hypothetical protein
MSVHGYASADAYLAGGRNRNNRPIANNTRVVRLPDGPPPGNDRSIAIRLHQTDIVVYHDDGTVQLFTGGWYTVTTKARINDFAPVRVGSDRGEWWLYGPNWTNASRFFEGIMVGPSGTVLNPRPQDVDERERAEARASKNAVRKYVDAYLAAATEQLYYDVLSLEDGDKAISCWDCSNPTMAGRTTEGGDASAHLRRHVERLEFPPALFYNALRAKGAGPYYFQQFGGAEYIVDLGRADRYQITQLRRWLTDLVQKQLAGQPFHDWSAERKGA